MDKYGGRHMPVIQDVHRFFVLQETSTEYSEI